MQMIKFYILQVRKTLFLLYAIVIVALACMLTIYNWEWQEKSTTSIINRQDVT